jgi:small subunit ribosomal protein S1
LPGVVKNITDYGVFVDLGGIDGLLHITDISWGRVNHPSEHFGVGDEIEIVVLKFDPETERVSLGYKQRTEDPWSVVDKKYPLGSRVKGKVVSLVDYGAFVEIEDGVEGLIHVSEMSWTKKVVNPAKILNVGDEVEAIVSELDLGQRRISLSLRQTERNPWEELSDSHPVGAIIEGRVRNLTDFGAFVEIEEGVEGLIHVSEMSWTKKVVNPAKLLSVDDQVEAIVSELDMDQRRISLSLRQTERNPWEELGDTHPEGTIIEGKVRNLTEFGAFVEITEGIDGLIHVSDMSWTKRVKHPSEVLKKGDTVKARITHIDSDNQRVSLSIKEFMPNEWEDFVGEHHVGDTVDGKVVNVTDFGLFIDIYQGLEGLAHISEIDVAPGSRLEDAFEVGDWVRARILRIEDDEKKVGLTMRGLLQPSAEESEALEAAATEQHGEGQSVRAAAEQSVVVEASEAAAEEAEEDDGETEAEAEGAEAEAADDEDDETGG